MQRSAWWRLSWLVVSAAELHCSMKTQEPDQGQGQSHGYFSASLATVAPLSASRSFVAHALVRMPGYPVPRTVEPMARAP